MAKTTRIQNEEGITVVLELFFHIFCRKKASIFEEDKTFLIFLFSNREKLFRKLFDLVYYSKKYIYRRMYNERNIFLILQQNITSFIEYKKFTKVIIFISTFSTNIINSISKKEKLKFKQNRIILQRILTVSNRLPKPEKYEEIWDLFSSEDKNFVIDCREKVWDLLEKLIQAQNNFRKQCPEYLQSLNKNSEESDDEDDEPIKIKRRKLVEYPSILEKQYTEYVSYRNSAIQKWNDRTKIASGKFAKSNFSAFDQPILQQIEHIMIDKPRLIQRTYTKRSQYHIIGENNTDETEDKSNKNDINSEMDKEIFDDDDFYHKLLRDYIEKKTINVTDPAQLGKKWIKLQSLRNKLKRKIDTRRTKGRKIKFDVHTKLINFMAPVVFDRWEDTAINELFSSLFGKKS
ncbi:hypothetical protein PGB90_002418 [Kerria lacca]